MNIDTEHLHHMMQAIRQSESPSRTLDAFWRGQILSKEWLIEKLSEIVINPVSIDIHGGWVGTLACLLFQSNLLKVTKIISVDIDHTCESIANLMNQIEYQQNRFSAITDDMCNVTSTSDVVINTSCEHITQEQYNQWLANISDKSIIVLQSNNYNIPEHIRIASSLDEFVSQSKIKVLLKDQLELPLYTRYMIIGYK